MKFKTQHRNHLVKSSSGRAEPYRVHRDGKKVWSTLNDRCTFSKEMKTVSEAKEFMLNPAV
jgi:hypothetical protein